jgi:hypothetical protein
MLSTGILSLHKQMTPEENMELENTKQERDEFLAARNRYANIAGQLAEYIRSNMHGIICKGGPMYPTEAMRQMDQAQGRIKYEWPTR